MKTVTVVCGLCHKPHEVSKSVREQFGYFTECQDCLDREHIRFMQTTGKELGLSCVKGCHCGTGKIF